LDFKFKMIKAICILLQKLQIQGIFRADDAMNPVCTDKDNNKVYICTNSTLISQGGESIKTFS